jgi:hypothetical protein
MFHNVREHVLNPYKITDKVVVLCMLIFTLLNKWEPIPVSVRSKAWVYGRSLTRIVGSNPTGGMDVCVVFVERTVAWNVK